MSPMICISLLLLLSLALPALSDKCPDHDRLPTTCDCADEFHDDDEREVELWCSNSTIGELVDALHLMDKSSRLDVQLNDMNLGYLPSRIFYGLNVVNLDISHCKLDGLAPPGETALQGLEEKLEVLVITSSFTEDERSTVLPSLAHLSHLKHLDLSENKIAELHDHLFSSPPPALSHLYLFYNGIKKLGDRAFEKLVNLEELILDGNIFGPIKRSMLPRPADRLEKLELINNYFTSVPDDLFTDMPALKKLSIRGNKITRLQKRAFKSIWSQLEEFDAHQNPLKCDSSMKWLFHVRTKATTVFGTCKGPSGRDGMELHDFIENKGQ